MNNCPKCNRPFNEGNSPNSEECNGTDDEEGVCQAYAKIHILLTELEDIRTSAHCIAKSGPATTTTLDDVWNKFNSISAVAANAIYRARHYK